jgi:hypothetical protein
MRSFSTSTHTGEWPASSSTRFTPEQRSHSSLVDFDSWQKEFREEIILFVLGNLIRIRRSSSQGYSQYPELDIRLSIYQIIIDWGVMFYLEARGKI